MQRAKFLIIGAGPTGLGAAMRLQELGECDFLILESAGHVAGLSASFVDEAGFTWDLGSHLQHSHYAKYDAYLDLAFAPDEWLHHRRSTWIWHSERFIPYPIQLNLHHLPEDERMRCVQGLAEASPAGNGSEESLATWIQATFGRGIAELFMVPYNEKVWARPVAQLSHTWVGDRVAKPNLEEVQRAIRLRQDNTTWGPNATFRYPRRGGTGTVWRRLADRLPQGLMRVRECVTSINRREKTLATDAGLRYRYEYLISTMPLDLLAERANPNHDLGAALRLKKTLTHVIGLGMLGSLPATLEGRFWGYYAQRDLPFYRLTVMSNLSADNTPDPKATWSLMAEVAESEYVKHADEIVSSVEQGLRTVGLISYATPVISRWHRRLQYGYPVPTCDRDKHLHDLLGRLQHDGVYSRGRFGAWKYEASNQDHSFMQGVEVVDHILFDHPELTLHEPNLVNGRYNPFPYLEWR